jgi:hypothetical protein
MDSLQEKNYEEVKSSIGYDMPLTDDSYSKEKASVFISFTIGSNSLDQEKYQEIATKKAEELANLMGRILSEKGVKMIDKLVEERITAIRDEYEDKLSKAREYVKKSVKK